MGLFFINFQFFNMNTILQKLNLKNDSARSWDLNSRTLEQESPPIATRAGLPPSENTYEADKTRASAMDPYNFNTTYCTPNT